MKICLPVPGSPRFTSPPVPQPASRTATPSSRTIRIKLRGRLVGRRAQLRDSFLARRVDREDAVEARNLEDLRDVAIAADERQLSVVRAQALDAADEHAEGRRVDEGCVGEVDDDVGGALADHVQKLLL